MSKAKPPKRSVEDQQFLDIAAIQIFAKVVNTPGVYFQDGANYASKACEHAEALLNERNSRL